MNLWERDLKIFRLSEQGASYAAIGRTVGLCRDRVRQICDRHVRQNRYFGLRTFRRGPAMFPLEIIAQGARGLIEAERRYRLASEGRRLIMDLDRYWDREEARAAVG